MKPLEGFVVDEEKDMTEEDASAVITSLKKGAGRQGSAQSAYMARFQES